MSDQTNQHILSLSYGKDSLACLGAIEQLGWPLDRAVTAINDLLARVEAAENERDRLREAMKLNCLQCESMHKNGNCMEVGGFCSSVPAAHCPLIPKLLKRTSEAEARAEKAERERDEYKVALQNWHEED